MELTVHDKPIDSIKLDIKEKKVKKISLAARKTLEGNVIVQDHHSINIVLMPDKGKILTFPKSEYNDETYDSQDQLFKYLITVGVVKPDSVNGSNIYGSLEAMYVVDKNGDEEPFEVVLLNIHDFLKRSQEDHKIHQDYIDNIENQLINPDEDESTELGEIPQDTFKGSIPKYGFPARGVYRYNY